MDTEVLERTDQKAVVWHEWLAWEEDVGPVPEDTVVEYVTAHGGIAEDEACNIYWNDQEGNSVRRFRIVQDSEETPGWVPWDATARLSGPGVLGKLMVKKRDGQVIGPLTVPEHTGWKISATGPSAEDIISYRRVSRGMLPGEFDGQIFKWRATPTAVHPLPEGTRMKALTRAYLESALESGDEALWSGEYDVTDFAWYGDEKNSHSIVRYKIVGHIPGQWRPHNPSFRGKRPCKMMDRVEIRLRDGQQVVRLCSQVNWGRIRRNHDREVVAWRFVK